MIISVPKETSLNETRVAATPQSVKELIKAGYKVKIQTGAGSKSFISDAAYKEVGANIIEVDSDLYKDSDVIIKVAPATPAWMSSTASASPQHLSRATKPPSSHEATSRRATSHPRHPHCPPSVLLVCPYPSILYMFLSAQLLQPNISHP